MPNQEMPPKQNPQKENLKKNLSEDIKQKIITEGDLKFIPSPKYEVPENFNYKSLEHIGIREESLKKHINSFINFLEIPIVLDKFGDIKVSKEEAYNKLSLEEKITFTKKVDKIILEFLELIKKT